MLYRQQELRAHLVGFLSLMIVHGEMKSSRETDAEGPDRSALCFGSGMVRKNALRCDVDRSQLVEQEIEPADGRGAYSLPAAGADPYRGGGFCVVSGSTTMSS